MQEIKTAIALLEIAIWEEISPKKADEVTKQVIVMLQGVLEKQNN